MAKIIHRTFLIQTLLHCAYITEGVCQKDTGNRQCISLDMQWKIMEVDNRSCLRDASEI